MDPPVTDTCTRFLLMGQENGSVFAPEDGLFEPARALGDHIEKGATAGWLHRLDTPEDQPLGLTFAGSGIVVRKRVPARVRRGDYLFHLGREMDPKGLITAQGAPPQ
jgi:predicted deacylase